MIAGASDIQPLTNERTIRLGPLLGPRRLAQVRSALEYLLQGRS